MSWFKRVRDGITTQTKDKKEVPDGMWYGCPSCKKPTLTKDHEVNFFVCPHCGYHERMGSEQYFELLFDGNKYKEFNSNLTSADPLKWEDSKKYSDRLVDAKKKSKLKDAIKTAYGKVNKKPVIIGCMDFTFIGGSMGSVVGEKISRAIDMSIEKKVPFLMISKSGGARMMEAALSLMQMAKTSAKLTQLSKAKLPYISLLTDPTTGGVTASFAMLGDLNIAEPGALIGFAGPRVIKETIGKDLPEGFQSSEFLLDHGFLDMIIDRRDLKEKLTQIFGLFAN